MGGGGPKEELVDVLDRLRVLRADAGTTARPFEAITLHGVGMSSDFDEVRALEAAGLTGVVNLPFRATLGRRSSLSDKKAALDRFAAEVMGEFA